MRVAAFADACRDQRPLEHHGGRLRPHRHVVQRRSTCSPGCTSRCSRATTSASPPRATTRPPSTPSLAGAGQARLRPAAPAAAARRPARATRTSRAIPAVQTNTGSLGMGVSKAKGFARAARLAGRPPARVRDHRRRRAAGGPVLGVARPGGQRGLRRDHRDRRPQQDPVRHLGRPGLRPRRPRGQGPRVRLGRRALRRQRRRAPSPRRSATCSSASRDRPKLLSPTPSRARARPSSRRTTSSAAAPRCTRTTRARPRRTSTRPRSPSSSAACADRLGREVELEEGAGAAPPGPPATPQKLVAAYGEALADAAGGASRGSSRSTPTSTSTAG